jgi:hypothetical protein
MAQPSLGLLAFKADSAGSSRRYQGKIQPRRPNRSSVRGDIERRQSGACESSPRRQGSLLRLITTVAHSRNHRSGWSG